MNIYLNLIPLKMQLILQRIIQYVAIQPLTKKAVKLFWFIFSVKHSPVVYSSICTRLPERWKDSFVVNVQQKWLTCPQGGFCKVTVNLFLPVPFTKMYWQIPRKVKWRPSNVVKWELPVIEHSAWEKKDKQECSLA